MKTCTAAQQVAPACCCVGPMQWPILSSANARQSCRRTLQGDDLQTVIPHERWAVEPVYAPNVATDKMYVRFGDFLPGVDLFDAAAFR